jgi:hypothetical protein
MACNPFLANVGTEKEMAIVHFEEYDVVERELMLTRSVRAAQGVTVWARGEGAIVGGSLEIMLTQNGLITRMTNEFGNRILEQSQCEGQLRR